MAPRRTFLPRPHTSLHAAAERHQAIVATGVLEQEETAPAEEPKQTDTERPARKRPARNREGKFA